MDKNLNMTGQDRLDALLFDIADEEDMKVDYAAMLDTVYKRRQREKNAPRSLNTALWQPRRQSHWRQAGCGLQ